MNELWNEHVDRELSALKSAVYGSVDATGARDPGISQRFARFELALFLIGLLGCINAGAIFGVAWLISR